MSESKELKYILATQPSFWVAGINCYDHLVAVATLVARQLSVEFEGEDELGEMNNGHPADVADCIAWLLREAELLPMTTIKDIVDDYRWQYHRYLATPSVESQAEFEAAIAPMLQATVDSAESQAVVVRGFPEEVIALLTSNEEEIEDIESADDRKKPDPAGLSDLARLIFYLAEGGLDDAISDSAESEAAPNDEPKAAEQIATDHRPSFADLDEAMKSWVVADIAQKIIDGRPGSAKLAIQAFCMTDTIQALVWDNLAERIKEGGYQLDKDLLESFGLCFPLSG